MEATNEIVKNPAGAQSRGAEAETTRNIPVLIQERRCSVCNMAQRRIERREDKP